MKDRVLRLVKVMVMRKSVLIAGVFFGLVCVVCVAFYAYLVQQEADSARNEAMQRYGGEQVDVLVATRDIYPGESVNSSNTTMRTWLTDLLPEESITNFDEVNGAQVTSLVLSGEAVSAKRFSAGTTSLDVPEGCVALSVPAEDVQAVGGALSPGTIVDVYATGAQTSCIGEGLLVLATNADTAEAGKTSVSWVTLAVPLEQSQEFVSASQSMDIYFTLPAQSSELNDESKGDESEGSEQRGAESKSDEYASDQASLQELTSSQNTPQESS